MPWLVAGEGAAGGLCEWLGAEFGTLAGRRESEVADSAPSCPTPWRGAAADQRVARPWGREASADRGAGGNGPYRKGTEGTLGAGGDGLHGLARRVSRGAVRVRGGGSGRSGVPDTLPGSGLGVVGEVPCREAQRTPNAVTRSDGLATRARPARPHRPPGSTARSGRRGRWPPGDLLDRVLEGHPPRAADRSAGQRDRPR